MLRVFGRAQFVLALVAFACLLGLRLWFAHSEACSLDAPRVLSGQPTAPAVASEPGELLGILKLGDVELADMKPHHRRAVTVVATSSTPSFFIVLRSPDQDKSVSKELARRGKIEFPKLHDAIHELAPATRLGALMVDVGANLGYFGLLARSLGYNSTFIDIQCGNVARIKLAARLNEWLDGVQVLRHAAGVRSGQVRQIVKGDARNPGGWGVGERVKGSVAVDECTSASVVQLDTVFPHETVDVMKIDVESYEREVLDGMAKMLESHRVRILVVEYWFVTGAEHFHKLLQFGYRAEECSSSKPIEAADISSFIEEISCEKYKDGRPCMKDVRFWLPH